MLRRVPRGPSSDGPEARDALHVLQNAVANGARVDTVNIMNDSTNFTWPEAEAAGHGREAITAFAQRARQLAALYPGAHAGIWRWRGPHDWPGIDDYPGKPNTLPERNPADPRLRTDHGPSACCRFWAIQRENGG